RRARAAERPGHDGRVSKLATCTATQPRGDRAGRRRCAHRRRDEGRRPVTAFAPVGNGRVLAYVAARPGEQLRHARGTNVLRIIESQLPMTRFEWWLNRFARNPVWGLNAVKADSAAIRGPIRNIGIFAMWPSGSDWVAPTSISTR